MIQSRPPKVIRRYLAPIVAAVGNMVLCLVVVMLIHNSETRRFREELRTTAVMALSQIRADLEAEIHANFFLTSSLIAYVETHPDLDQEQFSRIATNIIRHRPSIRNIGLAPQNVLRFIHPLQGNEKALGFRYSENKQQWPAVKRAIESGTTVVAGPVDLVQGGEAFISRTPIHIPPGGPGIKEAYWGIASVVIDKDLLLERGGFNDHDSGLLVALRGKDGWGAEGEYIAGKQEVFASDPIALSVRLPEGGWQVAAIPENGWNQKSPYILYIRIGGFLISLAFSSFVYLWFHLQLRSRQQIEEAKKSAENATGILAKNETFQNAILDNIPSLIFVKDARSLRYLRVNTAWERTVGIRGSEVKGRTDTEIFPDALAASFTAQDTQILTDGQQMVVGEEELESTRFGTRLIYTTKIPIRDEGGEMSYILGFSQDVTEIVKAREEKEELEKQLEHARRLESIGLMAGGVAHDLNNILAGIVGYPELLLRKLPPGSDLRKPLGDIHESGKRAAAVVADLLTIARGAVSSKMIENTTELVMAYLESPEFSKLKSVYPRARFTIKLEAERPDIYCSGVHVRKSLMNLVTNAVEALEEGGEVMISSTNRTIAEIDANSLGIGPGDYLLLSVCDDGPGIPTSVIDHVFEPFFTKKIMGRSGTGLGLTVVWNTLADHNGTVQVSSGNGTCFELYFPIDPRVEKGRTSQAEVGVPLGNGESILVVDDEPQLRDLASELLSSLNYQVTTSSSGEEAVAFLQQNSVDLVLLDMLMSPGINGRTTYKQILQFRPDQKAVVASGFAEDGDVAATLDLGAGGFIQKPYTLIHLGQTVRRVLDDRCASPQLPPR